MQKRILSLLLAAVMVLAVTGCRGAEPAPSSETAPAHSDAAGGDAGTPAPEAPGKYKIGILTGTASQGDEEITQANKMREKYPDIVVTGTYPDNFTTETETLISNAVAMASDPDVKAIVWCQAVPGTVAAINKVKETRPDMMFILGVAAEDYTIVTEAADVVLGVNEVDTGYTIPEQAKKQGAKTFIHYSFPRHMSYALIVARHEKMQEYCAANDMEFVDVTAPDPTGDSGVTGAQQFILEDVPREIAKYGKDTSFYCTNCSMQEPLIRTVFEQGGIYTIQCCPSPFHAFPAALNIDMAGHEADVDYIMEQLKVKTTEANMNGRVSTWGIPCNMLIIDAGVEYAMKILDGKTNGIVDDKAIRETIQECADHFSKGMKMDIITYDDGNKNYENYYMVMADFVDF